MILHRFQMEVKDVEELISVGEDVEACPYYGSRYAVPKAEVRTPLCFYIILFELAHIVITSDNFFALFSGLILF